MKIIRNIVLFSIIFWAMFSYISWTEKRDAELMKIQYCWDSYGNHYVAPNPACL